MPETPATANSISRSMQNPKRAFSPSVLSQNPCSEAQNVRELKATDVPKFLCRCGGKFGKNDGEREIILDRRAHV